MIRDKFIHYKGSSLHYAKAGSGNKHFLIFHGFGQDISVFEYFTQSLASHYTFYVFDLYFHGRSTWNRGEETLSKGDWKNILEVFLRENNIQEFSVGGFSLGGKFALATLEAFPRSVKELFLIAPDGIYTSFWYSLATYPYILRKFFRSMILYPERFESITKFLYKLRLADNGLIRFAEYQMNSKEKRRRVYYSWVVFRHMKFNMQTISKFIKDNDIRLTMIVGRYDKVIIPEHMNRLLKHLETYRFEILESGHSGLINQSLRYII